MSNLVQCNICQKWYSNRHGLLLHLRFCTERHASEQNDTNHHFLDHNPLISCHDQGEHLNLFAVYEDEFDISSIISQNSNFEQEQDNIGVGGTDLTEDADLPNYGYDDANGLCSTAISKLQIRLNDLINRHKAPLQLYDEIVHLINDYISSDNFSKYGKLKTRQSFIKQMELSHPSVTLLRPVDKQVILHDGTLVTVPVFNARAMIMDLLSNTELMIKENFAEGYDIFTGDVDDNHPSNRNYGEIHTGDEWIPARDRYCQYTNDMPIGIVIFGDKSHTDLHSALALTPIIFTLTLFNEKS